MEIQYRDDITWDVYVRYLSGIPEKQPVLQVVEDWVLSIDGVAVDDVGTAEKLQAVVGVVDFLADIKSSFNPTSGPDTNDDGDSSNS